MPDETTTTNVRKDKRFFGASGFDNTKARVFKRRRETEITRCPKINFELCANEKTRLWLRTKRRNIITSVNKNISGRCDSPGGKPHKKTSA